MTDTEAAIAAEDEFKPPPGWPLDLDMQQRAEALRIARTVGVNKGSPFGGVTVAIGDIGLIHLADYIILGNVPEATP